MKHLRHTISVIALTAVIACQAMSIKDIPNVHVADRSKFVADPTGVLSAAGLAKSDSIIASIWNQTSAEVVVAIVDTLDGQDIDTAATDLFGQWGIGKSDKDNGVLILIAKDDRKAAIRTGYGIEGVLPDIYCGRILRGILFPAFKQGDYDGGLIGALEAVKSIVSTPEAAEELLSRYENDADARRSSSGFSFADYLKLGAVVAVVMLLILTYRFFSSKKMERHDRYEYLRRLSLVYLIATVGFLGVPVVVYLLLRLAMTNVRRRKPDCPNCGHKMRLIDEVHDNDYLTPAQDQEEKLSSVDYDVWLCDNCHQTEIIPYVNHMAPYEVCPNCGARALVEESNRVTRQPTEKAEGVGCKTYACRNCHKKQEKLYRIAKLVTPPIIVGGIGGRGGGGFGGGGFGGGSFGGGMTGGGGASGGW